jgi:hypothetical protein
MNREKARKLVKQHIDTHGHTPIVISDRMIKYWWNVLNHAVFNGMILPLHSSEPYYSKDMFAWAEPEANKQIHLKIQHTFNDKTTFLTVLVHEMVHAWEYQKYGRMGHGKRFWGWKDSIYNATTLILDEDIDEYEHSKRSRNNRTHRSVELHGSKATITSTRPNSGKDSVASNHGRNKPHHKRIDDCHAGCTTGHKFPD